MAKNVFGHDKKVGTTFPQLRYHKTAILPTFSRKPYYYRKSYCKEGHNHHFSLYNLHFSN